MLLVFSLVWLYLVGWTRKSTDPFHIEFLVLINHYYLEAVLAIGQNSQGLILILPLLHCGQILPTFSFFAT